MHVDRLRTPSINCVFVAGVQNRFRYHLGRKANVISNLGSWTKKFGSHWFNQLGWLGSGETATSWHIWHALWFCEICLFTLFIFHLFRDNCLSRHLTHKNNLENRNVKTQRNPILKTCHRRRTAANNTKTAANWNSIRQVWPPQGASCVLCECSITSLPTLTVSWLNPHFEGFMVSGIQNSHINRLLQQNTAIHAGLATYSSYQGDLQLHQIGTIL